MQPGDIVLRTNAYKPEIGRVVSFGPKTVTVEVGYFQKFNTVTKPVFRQYGTITERWERNVIVLDTEERLYLAELLLTRMERVREQIADLERGARTEAKEVFTKLAGSL